MLGRNHALVGLSWFGASVWTGIRWEHLHALTAPQAGLGVLVAAGAALAPDLDERHSISGHANPISRLPIFGGHRRRTHCLLAVLLVGVAAYLCSLNKVSAAVLIGIMSIGGAAVLSRAYGHLGAVGSTAVGFMAAYAAYRWVPLGWWLWVAVVPPYFSHLIADQPWQLPLFLPFSRKRWRFSLFRVGGEFERIVMTPIVFVGAAVSLFEGLQVSFPDLATYVQATLHR